MHTYIYTTSYNITTYIILCVLCNAVYVHHMVCICILRHFGLRHFGRALYMPMCFISMSIGCMGSTCMCTTHVRLHTYTRTYGRACSRTRGAAYTRACASVHGCTRVRNTYLCASVYTCTRVAAWRRFALSARVLRIRLDVNQRFPRTDSKPKMRLQEYT